MKPLIMFALLLQLSHTSTLTLTQLLHEAKKTDLLTQALMQEKMYLVTKNEADTSLKPIKLYGTVARAYPTIGDDMYEYSLGISQTLAWGDSKQKDRQITQLTNEATLLEEDKNILGFENGLKSLYHNHCLDKKYYEVSKQNYKAFVKLYKKKQKAYKYQEISKAELMQLEIEKNRLYAQLQEIKMTQLISKQKLFVLGRLNNADTTILSCKDTYPIRENVPLPKERFTLSKEAHIKRLKSTQVTLERYSKTIDNINISAQYDKEINMNRVGIGISIPLNFTSNKSEKKRAAAMYKHSALGFQHEQMILEKESRLLALRTYLNNKAKMLKTLSNNHHNYKKQLLPLIKKSYDLGETSVIEYLLNRQKSYRLRQEIYATKKAYYKALFKLYTLSEMKDK